MKPKIFICYSHQDVKWKNSLSTHLNVLGQQGLLDVWDDSRIFAGEDWEKKINEAMESASAAIILVSKHSLTSRFILEEEFPKVLQRKADEGLIVIPIIVSACAWQKVDWLARLQVRPPKGTPIAKGSESDQDEKLSLIAEEVLSLLEKSDESSQDYDTTILPNTNIEKNGSLEIRNSEISYSPKGFLTVDMVKKSLTSSSQRFILSGLTNRNYCTNIEFFNIIAEKAKKCPDFHFEMLFLNPKSSFVHYAREIKRSPSSNIAKQITINAREAVKFFRPLKNNVTLYYANYPLIIPFIRTDNILHVSWAFRSTSDEGMLNGTVDAPYLTMSINSALGRKVLQSISSEKQIIVN